MNDTIELNREEITRLSRMDDCEGHAWALYLLLKKHMDDYTGIVHVDIKILAQVLQEKLIIKQAQISTNINNYLRELIYQLLKVDVITDYLLKNDVLSIKLPIAYGDVCMEDFNHH